VLYRRICGPKFENGEQESGMNQELEEMSKGENIVKWIKREKDKLAKSPGENGGGQGAQKELHPRTRRDETAGKTQERMERGSRKRSSSAGGKKMERIGER
jgi:hypothetical protein